jgi:hypothetical protein
VGANTHEMTSDSLRSHAKMRRRDLSRDLWNILFHVGIKLQHLSIQCHVGRCELAVSRCVHVILLLKAAHLLTVNATQARTTSLHHRPMLIHGMCESKGWGVKGQGQDRERIDIYRKGGATGKGTSGFARDDHARGLGSGHIG